MEKATYIALHGDGYLKYLFQVDWTLTAAAGQFSISYVIPVENTWFLFGYTAGDSRLLPVDRELKT